MQKKNAEKAEKSSETTESGDGVMMSTSLADQVYTDNFKNWFGDWENDPENASKVVDENDRPLVVYHRSRNKWNVWDKNKGRFIYAWNEGSPGSSTAFGGNEYSLYMNLRNPFIFDANFREEDDLDFSEYRGSDSTDSGEIAKWAEENGYDGVIIKNVYEFIGHPDGTDYIAFRPEQIKSK